MLQLEQACLSPETMADDKLKLKSSQGEIFEVEPEVPSLRIAILQADGSVPCQVATMSTLIKNMVEVGSREAQCHVL